MKIKCGICGSPMNDTDAICPECGTSNKDAPFSEHGQPVTIEGLKQWYADRGLPPYKTTRFFIGEDHKGPKAFGIYRDEKTGNFVVYKNKDTGERAVRYEGPDEAYAVNEILERLKQEILRQKSAHGSGSGKRKDKGLSPKQLAAAIGGLVAFFAAVSGIANFAEKAGKDEPKAGYYSYNGSAYYYSAKDYGSSNRKWFKYDASAGDYEFPVELGKAAGDLQKNKTAKKYFLGKNYDSSYSCADFSETIWAKDIAAGFYPKEGYYSCGGNLYFHFNDLFDKNWFSYESEWKRAPLADLPEELRHTSAAPDMFLSASYQSSMNAQDFSETVFFRDHEAGESITDGYYSYQSDIYYHMGGYYSSYWYYYGMYGWEEYDYDDLPYELQHPSVVPDYYYSNDWDGTEPYTDFEKTEYYSDYQAAHSSSSSDSNSNYNWDGGSWDSGSMDWSSDW